MIKISEVAKEKLIDVLHEEQKTLVRFGLKGGGCSGFQYYFAIEDTVSEDDFTIPLNETFNLLVDSMSMQYLQNADVDYKEELNGEGFIFNNPDAAGTTCGCGNSFSG